MKYTIKGGVKGPDQYTQKTTTGRKKATGSTKNNKTIKKTINKTRKQPNDLKKAIQGNLPEIMKYIVKTRTVTFAKLSSNPKPHKAPKGYESNNSRMSGVSNNNNVQEIRFTGVKSNKRDEFIKIIKTQIHKCLKNAQIKDNPRRGSYTYVLGKKNDKYEIWMCRSYSKQEIHTLHVNIAEMMEMHRDLIIIAGEMQIIQRCDLDSDEFKKNSGINVKKTNGNQEDILYLFNFESGTFSAAKLRLPDPDKQTAIDKFINIVKNTLSQYDIPEKNIIYINSPILNQKQIVTSRKMIGDLQRTMDHTVLTGPKNSSSPRK
jgi:hypothetical protein